MAENVPADMADNNLNGKEFQSDKKDGHGNVNFFYSQDRSSIGSLRQEHASTGGKASSYTSNIKYPSKTYLMIRSQYEHPEQQLNGNRDTETPSKVMHYDINRENTNITPKQTSTQLEREESKQGEEDAEQRRTQPCDKSDTVPSHESDTVSKHDLLKQKLGDRYKANILYTSYKSEFLREYASKSRERNNEQNRIKLSEPRKLMETDEALSDSISEQDLCKQNLRDRYKVDLLYNSYESEFLGDNVSKNEPPNRIKLSKPLNLMETEEHQRKFTNEVFTFVVKCHNGIDDPDVIRRIFGRFPSDCDVVKWFKSSNLFRTIDDEGETLSVFAFLKDISYCVHYTRPFGCTKEICSRFHVCMHMLCGNCDNGGNCEYFHDCLSERNKVVVDSLNLLADFTNEDIYTLLKLRYPHVCKIWYFLGTCKGKRCIKLHICPEFIWGSCEKGENCPKGHDFLSPHNAPIAKAYNLQYGDVNYFRHFVYPPFKKYTEQIRISTTYEEFETNFKPVSVTWGIHKKSDDIDCSEKSRERLRIDKPKACLNTRPSISDNLGLPPRCSSSFD